MEKNEVIEKMCTSKHRYTKKMALTVKNKVEKQRYGHGNIRVYQCLFCNYWHLTKK